MMFCFTHSHILHKINFSKLVVMEKNLIQERDLGRGVDGGVLKEDVPS